MAQLLVVDDERSMREFLAICLRRAGHQVTIADSGRHALTLLKDTSQTFDVVITDLRMPDQPDGLGLLSAIKSGATRADARDTRATPEVVLMTAFASADTALAAMKQGAYDYLTKPFKVDEINAVVSRALEKQALVTENLALKDRVAGRVRLASLLGKSRAMTQLFETIQKIHSAKTNVLITGESGTGKELVARALHTEGARASAPFVAVNCGAIPEELMESELFGHKKGAYTGAVTDTVGLFREAEGGTLFLDEIGELSLGLQVKLLRVLQERKVKAIGSVDEQDIDVRVVAATNRDLEAEVARGSFRTDLYYRLNVIEIRIPPLRQRKEDIPLLVEHFLRRFGSDHGRQMKIDPEAVRRLESYDFPGNVRELENVIERAVALASSDTIGVADLPDLRGRVPQMEQTTVIPPDGIDLERLVSDFERAWVQRALDQAGGIRTRAARLLGISFRALRYRLKKLGLADSAADSAESVEEPADE